MAAQIQVQGPIADLARHLGGWGAVAARVHCDSQSLRGWASGTRRPLPIYRERLEALLRQYGYPSPWGQK